MKASEFLGRALTIAKNNRDQCLHETYSAYAYDPEERKWHYFWDYDQETEVRLALTPLAKLKGKWGNPYSLACRIVTFAKEHPYYSHYRIVGEDGFVLPFTISTRKDLRH